MLIAYTLSEVTNDRNRNTDPGNSHINTTQ